MLDFTHDRTRSSWVASANADGCDFPIQNLPYGVFNTASDAACRIGVAIGDQILDCRAALGAGLLDGLTPDERSALESCSLNALMGLGRASWKNIRAAMSNLLADGDGAPSSDARDGLLVAMADATMHVPAQIGDYTDFYASVHHATNIGSMFRPDNPLLPNYKHIPIGYHGRASSVIISGTPVRRPHGQLKPGEDAPTFGPCRLLDYELEMGFFVGSGNALGDRVAMEHVDEQLFGMVLVNDWSARDIQKWEYQPLGPFNAKNFATSISPWVVTMEALAPFRIDGPPRGENDPAVLDYLKPTAPYGLDIQLEVQVQSETMRDQGMNPFTISRGMRIAQMVVAPVTHGVWQEVEALPSSARGAGGFGSTGTG